MAVVLLIDEPAVAGGRQNVIRTSYWRGQVFTPAADTWVTDVEFYSKAYGIAPVEGLRLNIYACDGSHLPTGAVLDTVTIPATEVSLTFAWITGYTFNRIKLSAGVEYCLTMECDGGDSSNFYLSYEIQYTWHGLYSSTGGILWRLTTYEKTVKLYGDTYVFSPPSARDTKKRLISVAEDALWYESI